MDWSSHSTDDSDVSQRQPGTLQCAAVHIHTHTRINVATRGKEFMNGRTKEERRWYPLVQHCVHAHMYTHTHIQTGVARARTSTDRCNDCMCGPCLMLVEVHRIITKEAPFRVCLWLAWATIECIPQCSGCRSALCFSAHRD